MVFHREAFLTPGNIAGSTEIGPSFRRFFYDLHFPGPPVSIRPDVPADFVVLELEDDLPLVLPFPFNPESPDDSSVKGRFRSRPVKKDFTSDEKFGLVLFQVPAAVFPEVTLHEIEIHGIRLNQMYFHTTTH